MKSEGPIGLITIACLHSAKEKDAGSLRSEGFASSWFSLRAVNTRLNPSSYQLSCRYKYQSLHPLSIHFGNFSLCYRYLGKLCGS